MADLQKINQQEGFFSFLLFLQIFWLSFNFRIDNDQIKRCPSHFKGNSDKSSPNGIILFLFGQNLIQGIFNFLTSPLNTSENESARVVILSTFPSTIDNV